MIAWVEFLFLPQMSIVICDKGLCLQMSFLIKKKKLEIGTSECCENEIGNACEKF